MACCQEQHSVCLQRVKLREGTQAACLARFSSCEEAIAGEDPSAVPNVAWTGNVTEAGCDAEHEQQCQALFALCAASRGDAAQECLTTLGACLKAVLCS